MRTLEYAHRLRIEIAIGLAMHNRNDPTGLVERAMKNLAALEHVAEIGADVHLITQLILSLLALVVFPRERAEFGASIYRVPLLDLEAEGWPKWHHVVQGKVRTLDALLTSLRHAISHSNVTFSSEAREYQEVQLEFKNLYNGVLLWHGEINAADLRMFCNLLHKFIRSR